MKRIIFYTTLMMSCNVLAESQITTAEGMTLYSFDNDRPGLSTCYDTCAVSWPPYLVTDNNHSKAGWGMTTRDDGSKQWTFNDKPLYLWVGDKKPGDTNGKGIGGVWHVAKKVKMDDNSDYESDEVGTSSRYGYGSGY